MLIVYYKSKKALKESVGKPLRYAETSMFGDEYPANGTGKVTGSNRPPITQQGTREFYASITLEGGLIKKVS